MFFSATDHPRFSYLQCCVNMRINTSIAIVGLILVSTLLQGCKINPMVYFRNNSDRAVSILIDKKTIHPSLQRFPVQYTNSILDINKRTIHKLKDTLIVHDESDQFYRIDIPAHSTVHVPQWIYLSAPTTTQLSRDNDSLGLVFVDTLKGGTTKRGGSLMPGYVVYYDYPFMNAK
jgi:hypothetical protein